MGKAEILPLWAALLVGCAPGPVASPDGDDEVGESGTESGDESGSSSDTDTSSDGDSSSDTDTSSDTDSGSGSDTGEPLCPEPQPVTARFSVTPPEPLAATCSLVGESVNSRDQYEMQLDCEGAAVTVTLESTIPYFPNPSPLVELDYRSEALGPGLDRWIAVRYTESQSLVFGGVAASQLDPPGTTLADFFGDPEIGVAADQPCEALADDCGEYRRLALSVSTELFGEHDPVFDHGSWLADFLAFGYAIEVEEASRRLPPVNCDDLPDEWFQLLVVSFPSD